MYHQIYQAPVRSEWSEFSLRSRPPKIRRFQAGPSNSAEDEESSVLRRKTERDLLRKRPCLRNENVMEDSIEFDVFTIAMSYPEGRQRMLDKLDAKLFSHHSNKKPSTNNLQPSKSSTEKGYNIKSKKSSEKSHERDNSEKSQSKDQTSRSSFRDRTPLKNESKEIKDNRKERKEGQADFRSKSHEESKPRSRSRSPPIENKHGRRMFTSKKIFEKRQPKFSLRDILGKHADETKSCENKNLDVDSEEYIDVGTENENLDQEELVESEEIGSSSPIPDMFFNNSFPEDVDAWIEEFSSKENGSLLAMLNSPMVDDNNNNNNYSSNTEVESDDARYYYENMMNTRESDHGSSEKIWSNGSLVWGRLSKTRWWPAIIIDGPVAGQIKARAGWTWLMWFGDHKISQMRLSQVVNFTHQFRQHCRGKLSSALEYAIIEALKVCADRADISLDGYNNIRRWGLLEMGFHDIVDVAEKDVDPFVPKTGSEFPAMILKELRKLRDQANSSDFDSDEDFSLLQKEEPLEKSGNFETGILKDVDFCLSCAKHGRKIVGQHPVFEGYVCSKCRDALTESLLALDNDGCNLFCAVCGEGGELYVCEEKDCGRSFCVRCMRHYLSADALKQARGQSPWLCFLCTNYSLMSHGVLVPREGWRDELIKFYNPVFDQVIPSYDTVGYTGRKLRVLSLFDGIGSLRLALDQLQLDVEAYYAAESDANAQHVSLFNQGFAIVHLGDVNNITKDKLQEICPIDLVVASPPSEDLDVTNREYEGFNGTGMLMFKFLMILKDVETICKGSNSVYWLVESTAAMKSEFRKILSNFFQKEPCMWDAQFFSPYVLPKFYWGNIPALYSSFQYYKDNKEHFPTLESYLAANIKRFPQVKKLRNCAIDMQMISMGGLTVDDELVDPDSNKGEGPDRTPEPKRSSANSTMFSLPVQMDGMSTNIWIGEVERVLGLPVHYTDVSRLTIPQRQKLLKHASSVHLLKHLLAPLTDIFLTHV
ncbi:DNA (cytosine-5)-methyltransferase 3B-like isoform X2 [Mercenaria mercenaria]|uniref:DNA (cytosine-5)-methyltransferase 3B-like isoform X2 n=1 Tax=Mercenaria mercenaria TaxID=6596 RepID=UPI00234E6F6D|nr:DNA (cytosine-5)-methyltransferase 3B-like isoform X2 [Mercenaria mercenaria]